MKKLLSILILSAIALTGCQTNTPTQDTSSETLSAYPDAVKITLSDNGVVEDSDAVYTANDIIYYESGKDFTYGEGTSSDEHEKEEADEHTVVHITAPGTYEISGKLSKGQIAVDLGEDAKDDETAVVTLVLNNADITCTVAPAVIFYNVCECGDKDSPSMTVDTKSAGANVIIADGSVNNVNGSYVARIYKSVELSEDGTEVVDSKKLHKYDGAFYSKMSMNVNGGEKGDGVLNITAENEGLDSELHLTINGGNINITSGNDGINTNEDEVSVTTVNGGNLNIIVNGSTGEGDGIDSNGWLVINGGKVTAQACSTSGDAGIDSDMGIYLNGGSVIATGNMLDRISGGNSTYAVFNFSSSQKGGETYSLKNQNGETVWEFTPQNNFTYLIASGEGIDEGTYTLWQGNTQLQSGGMGNMGGGMNPGGQRPQGERPELPDGEMPQMPEGFEPPEKPEGDENFAGKPPMNNNTPQGEVTKDFTIKQGANYFSGITTVTV